MNHDDSHLGRAEALVRRGAGGEEVLPAEPAPSVRDIGARAGFGRAWTSTSVRASVYLFDSHDEASAAEAQLEAQAPAGRQVAGTVNGPLLLWATADATDEAGEAVIERLLSSFAGDE
ncbi:hypothetical protein HPC49_04490 [Pyxidicoccus fallax]|uniref:Uncharacterized protein n=1 Tax=Pyxidicoccus fallax TaxID=394095 RepID=A0A848L9K3_9BACT|nr:hypothetical protein [Pyxidicoccus fallax]NMO14932.1 hypothetical protein [Pyxidicoccus fallax]NPC77508.1 hypothetical protein [Pyxidicoccus fallax]